MTAFESARISNRRPFSPIRAFARFTVLTLFCICASVAQHGARQGVWLRDVPAKPDAKAKYLFYLHGRIVEEQGTHAVSPEFGAYEYEKIVQTFVEEGFVVISEPRPRGTDVREYAGKVAKEVNALLAAGVPPQHVTVVGASKGGGIAAATSTLLRNRDVNFVLIAACGDKSMHGRILSIWDYKDATGAATCERHFGGVPGIKEHKEVELKLGLGHGLLYRPLPQWVDLVVDWANLH